MSDRAVDPDKLLADLDERATEVQELLQEAQAAPSPSQEDSERLTKSIAENLAKIREASGLPAKSVSEFEDQIRSRQHS